MKQFIAELLGLQGWIIYRVKIESDRIDVYAGRPRKEASCPSCQTLTRRVHDRSREWRPKLHTRCNGLPVYLWVRPRRFKCPNCGKVFTERFPGIRPRARRTERAEADWLENLKDRSFRRAAEVVRTSPGTLRRLLLKQVTNQVNIEEALKDLPALALSIDEHSFRGQDMMITVTCVWPERRLIAILPDDRLKTLEKFLKELPASVRRRIKAVCIDFKDGWRKLIKRVLPGVPVVVDHFHALKDANRRVDEARLIEQQVTGQRIPRWPLVKNEEDLTERQAAQLAMISRRYRNVAHFHWAKEQLRDVYRASCRKEAELILDRLILNTREASDVALVQWGRTLRSWREEILAYHNWRVTNGYTEGVHTKIKLLKRISYGFRNRGVYVRKMLLAFLPLAWLISPPHFLT
ncbi:ISL3 family transposase [Desulfothermobacter acidiphilus]|uniref:ISL3 family transposase n=1 Tax=Desulfothermobacter acidiphilus TaxID=1938353 RepID=UPI003F8ABDAD